MDLKITPSVQTIVKPTALGPVANTDSKLLIYGLFQKGRVLAQDAIESSSSMLEDGSRACLSSKRTSFRTRCTGIDGVSRTSFCRIRCE